MATITRWRLLRERAGLTQQQLADRSGVGKSTIRELDTGMSQRAGQKGRPVSEKSHKLSTLEKVAAALGHPLSYFFG